MVSEENFKKYFFWAILLVLAILSYLIIRDYIVAIVSSFVLAYLLLPLHKTLSKKLNAPLSAIISLLLVLFITIILLYLIANTLAVQIETLIGGEPIQDLSITLTNLFSQSDFLDVFTPYIPKITTELGNLLTSITSYLIFKIPNLIITIILTFFISYFVLINWSQLKKTALEIMPFKDNQKVISKISHTSNDIVFGSMIVAIMEFVVASIGLRIAGVSFYAFFALLIAIFAFVPLLGPNAVWVPLLIYKIIQGQYLASVIILITGLIVGAGLDGFIRTIVIGKKADIHPVVVLIGILGGVKLFGLFGFVIGPLVLSFFIEFSSQALKESSFNNSKSKTTKKASKKQRNKSNTEKTESNKIKTNKNK